MTFYQHSLPCVCEKVLGGDIQARNRRSSAAKCAVQNDFAENYTCASDSIHKGSFVEERVHGVTARSASNYVALVAMSSGDLTVVIYLNRSGRKFSIVDPKEWLVDKVDILRVLMQPSLDNGDRYDFGEIDI